MGHTVVVEGVGLFSNPTRWNSVCLWPSWVCKLDHRTRPDERFLLTKILGTKYHQISTEVRREFVDIKIITVQNILTLLTCPFPRVMFSEAPPPDSNFVPKRLQGFGNQLIHSDLVEIYNIPFAYVMKCVYQIHIIKFDERLTEKTTRGDNWSAAITGRLPVCQYGHSSSSSSANNVQGSNPEHFRTFRQKEKVSKEGPLDILAPQLGSRFCGS